MGFEKTASLDKRKLQQPSCVCDRKRVFWYWGNSTWRTASQILHKLLKWSIKRYAAVLPDKKIFDRPQYCLITKKDILVLSVYKKIQRNLWFTHILLGDELLLRPETSVACPLISIKGLFTLRIIVNATMLPAISIWLTCFEFLMKQVGCSKKKCNPNWSDVT